jgi:Surface-adhesin protein E
MPVTLRPYHRFLPLVYCSGVWSLITVLLLSVGPAYGEWVEVTANETEGMTVYADLNTVSRKGDLVKMWALFDFKTTHALAGISYLSSKNQYEFDCVEERRRILAFWEFSDQMGYGKAVYNNTDEGNWTPLPPGSIGHALWTVACEKQ